MKSGHRWLGAALWFAFAAGPGAAATATPEQAQALTATFQRYLGTPPAGQAAAVTVTPAGEAYRVEVDLARLLAPFASTGLTFAKSGNYVASLTPQPDGTWRVVSDGFPAVAVTQGARTTTFSYDNNKFDGVYDPAIPGFKASLNSYDGVTTGSVSPQLSNNTRWTGQSRTTQTGTPDGKGAANVEQHQTVTGLDYAINAQDPGEGAAAPGVVLSGSAASLFSDTALTHLPLRALLDLWAFLVAHPSKEQMAADQDTLKDRLRAVLAADTTVSVQTGARQLAANTPQGAVSVGEFSQRIDIRDRDDGGDDLSLGGKASNLAVPLAGVPFWAKGLVPTAYDFGLTVGPVYPGAAMRAVVDALDLSADKPLPDEAKGGVLQSFAKLDQLAVTLAPTTITTELASLKAEGTVRMGSTGAPIGTATVSATGLDKTINALQAAGQTSPDAQQAFQVLMLAKQIAKPEPGGAYSWRVEAAAGQPVTVNGQALGQGAAAKPRKQRTP